MTIFGVGVGGYSKATYGSFADKSLKAVRSIGCKEIRYSLFWQEVETRRGVYNWQEQDWAVNTAARHNLRVLPIVYRTPSWLASSPTDPPPASEYANFVRQVALRYGINGTFWNENPVPYLPIKHYEIWNEQNYFTAEWSGTPQEYADIYRASRATLKWMNSDYEAIVGGLAYPNLEWLKNIWSELGPVDSVGWHPYGITVQGTYYWISQLATLLNSLGATNTLIDITEIGIPVGRPGESYTEEQRGKYLRKMAETIKEKKRVRRFNVYTWFPASDPFSISKPDGTLKPSAKAYGVGIKGTLL